MSKSQLGKQVALAFVGLIFLILGVSLPSSEWSAPANAMRLSPSIFNSEFEITPRMIWRSGDVTRNPNRVDVGFTISAISQKKLKGKVSLLRTSTQENRNLQLVLNQRGELILRLPTLFDNSWRPRDVLVEAAWGQNNPTRIDIAFDDTRLFFSIKLNGHLVNLERDLEGKVISPGTIVPWFDFLELGTFASSLPVKITDIGLAIGPIPFQLNLQHLKLFLLVLSLLFFYPVINLFLYSQRVRTYRDELQSLYTRVDAVLLSICVLATLIVPTGIPQITEEMISETSHIETNEKFEVIIKYELISKPISKFAFVTLLGKEHSTGLGLSFDQFGSQFVVLGSKTPTGKPLGDYQLIPMNNSEMGSHEIHLTYSGTKSENATLDIFFDGTKVGLIDAVTNAPPLVQNLDLVSLTPIQISPSNDFGASSEVDSIHIRHHGEISLLGPLARSAVIVALSVSLTVLKSHRRRRKAHRQMPND